METNQIYVEPCLETLKKMPDNFLDCVITSPPYWQLRDYGYEGQWGLEPTFNEYLENLWSMMDEIYRALKPTGTCWINLGDTYNTISGGIRGLERAKKNGATRSISKKNIIGQGFQQQKSTEVANKCLLLIPDGTTKPLNNPTKPTSEFGQRNNIWQISTAKPFGNHPAVFPEQLAIDHIQSWSNEGDLIYDPFMGSGTTALASIKLNRNWIGSEISEEYVQVANKRVEPLIKQTKLF